MQRAAVLALATLASCGDVVMDPSPFEAAEAGAPPTADEAIGIAMRLYADAAGFTAPEVRVRWWEGDWIRWGDGLITGITFSCDDVWVWTPPSRRVSDTALAHELAHCANLALGNDGDPGHSSPGWWGPDGYAMQALLALQIAGL